MHLPAHLTASHSVAHDTAPTYGEGCCSNAKLTIRDFQIRNIRDSRSGSTGIKAARQGCTYLGCGAGLTNSSPFAPTGIMHVGCGAAPMHACWALVDCNHHRRRFAEEPWKQAGPDETWGTEIVVVV
ncbi:hypothetical protein M3J09_000216 [Ascochyta lentis]